MVHSQLIANSPSAMRSVTHDGGEMSLQAADECERDLTEARLTFVCQHDDGRLPEEDSTPCWIWLLGWAVIACSIAAAYCQP